MLKEDNLLKTLLNKNNNYLNDDSNFNLNVIYTKLLFLIIFLVVIVGLCYRFINVALGWDELSFIELTSLVIGNACFYACFQAIKNDVILNIVINPLFIGGIILPGFFWGWLLNYLLNLSGYLTYNLSFIFIIIAVISYYLILNWYYVKHYTQDTKK